MQHIRIILFRCAEKGVCGGRDGRKWCSDEISCCFVFNLISGILLFYHYRTHSNARDYNNNMRRVAARDRHIVTGRTQLLLLLLLLFLRVFHRANHRHHGPANTIVVIILK